MFAYQQEKIENGICYFALVHNKKAARPLDQTTLYKYLAFLDFESIRETGKPAFGLKYLAMERGPVPIDIYNRRDNYKTALFEFKKREENQFVIEPKKKPDLDYFSEWEIKKMNDLLFIFATKHTFSRHASQASHELDAYKKAWARAPNSIIDFADTFEGLLTKPEDEITPAEEAFLVYLGLQNAAQV